MKNYALVNYSTGEIFSMSSDDDGFTAQTLYRRADSLRRECIRYGYAQSTLELINCSKCPNAIRDGIIMCQWAGGTATPVEEMGFSVRTLHHLVRTDEERRKERRSSGHPDGQADVPRQSVQLHHRCHRMEVRRQQACRHRFLCHLVQKLYGNETDRAERS